MPRENVFRLIPSGVPDPDRSPLLPRHQVTVVEPGDGKPVAEKRVTDLAGAVDELAGVHVPDTDVLVARGDG